MKETSKKGAKPNKTPKLFYHIINKKPIIIITYGGESIGYISELLKKNRAYIIIGFWWSRGSEKSSEKIKRDYIQYKKKYPAHELTFLCNSPIEYKLLGKFNIPRIFCNHNAFLDEKQYRIIPNIQKKYDAVYNAQMAFFKRHYLAQKIKSLALITYQHSFLLDEERKKCFNEVRRILPDATMLNYINHPKFKNCIYTPDILQIPENKISEHLNSAKVGLILSEAEGACYASCEYLLSGLPVVSTKSRGGRDVFFDKEYIKVVDDTPEAVKNGVEELIKKHTSAEYIRKKTLEKIKAHRERFIALIQKIYDKEGINKDFRKEWDKIFFNRMVSREAWPSNF